jgi:serine protease AprX
MFKHLRIASILVLTPLAAAVVASSPVTASAQRAPGSVSVIITASPGAPGAAEAAVGRVGGTVIRRFGIIRGVAARVPASAVGALRSSAGVQSVALDGRLQAESVLPGSTYEQTTATTSIYNTTMITGAQEYWKRGFTGKGVDVAIIDTGVAALNGLNGRVINGPDLSFESQDTTRRYKDNFGHGTHLAGIIAGKDDGVTTYVGNSADFVGMAPDARIVNVKVADGNGVTDVSQVIAAIDWIVTHKTDNGMNIKVLELAFSTDSSQDYKDSPLTYALEVAWRAGITVVVAAGNEGKAAGLAMPAVDPWLLAVGASDTMTTATTADDVVANFSSTAKSTWAGRGPDVVAPGVSIPSLRVPGSKVDGLYPTARVGDRFFKGSGTSQASAVVAGAAALIAQERPTATPDQIKGELKLHAFKLKAEPATAQGNGEINLAAVVGIVDKELAGSKTVAATGTGSLEATRGTQHVALNGVSLSGDKDIFGKAFDAKSTAASREKGQAWSGARWNGSSWSGSSWSGSSWSGSSWSGSSWSGSSWSGSSWSGSSWSGCSWSGSIWG